MSKKTWMVASVEVDDKCRTNDGLKSQRLFISAVPGSAVRRHGDFARPRNWRGVQTAGAQG